MTTFRQIEANRFNARKSTGPKTEAGKDQSRRNAVRHGLTAETVIGLLEDAEDYRQFEAAVIADYDAQSAVERELVLRLASVLWRLRRATAFETGLLEIQAEHSRESQESRYALSGLREHLSSPQRDPGHDCFTKRGTDGPTARFAQCFLRLADLTNFALERLSRYEASLWRQAGQIIYALEMLDRRKPQERTGRFWFLNKKQIERDEHE
jgi:hypothetical protein